MTSQRRARAQRSTAHSRALGIAYDASFRPAPTLRDVQAAATVTPRRGKPGHWIVRITPSTLPAIDASVPVSSTYVQGLERAVRQVQSSRGAYLGGPAALALNEGLKVVAGRGLDHLVRNTNDGSWPPVSNEPDAPRVTLEIE